MPLHPGYLLISPDRTSSSNAAIAPTSPQFIVPIGTVDPQLLEYRATLLTSSVPPDSGGEMLASSYSEDDDESDNPTASRRVLAEQPHTPHIFFRAAFAPYKGFAIGLQLRR